MDKICGWIERGCCLVMVIFLAIMVVVVFAQVVWRYVLSASIFWSEELSRYLMVWATMLASSVCLRRGSHMAVRFIHDLLPRGLRKLSSLVVYTAILGFLGVVFGCGITLVSRTWTQISPTLSLPMGLVYACVPLGALLMAVQTVGLLGRIWRSGGIDQRDAATTAEGG